MFINMRAYMGRKLKYGLYEARPCTICEKFLAADQFYMSGKYRSYYCKNCHKDRNSVNRSKPSVAAPQKSAPAKPIIDEKLPIEVEVAPWEIEDKAPWE